MDEVMATLQAIRHAVELVDAKVTGIEHRMDKLEQRMDKLEQRMDTLEQRMDTLEQRMDTLEQRMGTLEQRVHSGFLDVGRMVDSISEDITVLDEMYGRHERLIRRQRRRAQ